MRVEKFEDLVAWQKARELSRLVYGLTCRVNFSRDYGLREQVQRSSVSIMSNPAEGFERGSSGEFHQFIVIAKASCAELRSQLYVARDVGYINEDEFVRVKDLADEVSRIIGGLKAAVRKRRDDKP